MNFGRGHGPYSALIWGYLCSISRRRAACGSGSLDQTKSVRLVSGVCAGEDTTAIVPRLWPAVDGRRADSRADRPEGERRNSPPAANSAKNPSKCLATVRIV